MDNLLSFAESNYDIEDWIPIVEPFDEHPRLEARGPFHNHRNQIEGKTDALTQDTLDYFSNGELDRLENPEQNYQLEVFYDIEKISGQVAAWLSPEIRQEGKMLEGDLSFETDIEGAPVTEGRKQIVEEYRTPYLHTNEDLGTEENMTLAFIQVPEGYNPDTLKETVQAIVNIYNEAQRLEDTLAETIREYEIQ